MATIAPRRRYGYGVGAYYGAPPPAYGYGYGGDGYGYGYGRTNHPTTPFPIAPTRRTTGPTTRRGRESTSRSVSAGNHPSRRPPARQRESGLTIGRLQYTARRPTSPLDRYVECFWALEGEGSPGSVERVLPDGCVE